MLASFATEFGIKALWILSSQIRDFLNPERLKIRCDGGPHSRDYC